MTAPLSDDETAGLMLLELALGLERRGEHGLALSARKLARRLTTRAFELACPESDDELFGYAAGVIQFFAVRHQVLEVEAALSKEEEPRKAAAQAREDWLQVERLKRAVRRLTRPLTGVSSVETDRPGATP